MPNPFPGIDPYLEAQGLWPDFHTRFITHCCEALGPSLPREYVARLDERMSMIDLSGGPPDPFRPDVAVVRREGDAAQAARPGRVAVAEPVTVPVAIFEEFREVFIEILHRPGRRLVAVLELLSPSNKTGVGYRDHVVRRNALLTQEIHLIELDFLLGGRRLPMAGELPRGDY